MNDPKKMMMSARSALRDRLRVLIGSTATAQGAHLDPLVDPRPDASSWGEEFEGCSGSAEFASFRASLCLPGQNDARAGVIDDLATRYDLDPGEVVQRALNWESWSVEEWGVGPRDDPSALRDFYRTTVSWSFDLLWYAYLEAEQYCPPTPVAVVRYLAQQGVGCGEHLDLGSGAGVTSQLFAASGFDTTLADVADELLGFARFRLERRGTKASYINLNEAGLPADTYDVITALDVLAHVPDLNATLAGLDVALRPGGWLLVSFDARAEAPESAWHLYEDEFTLRAAMDRAGFVERDRVGSVCCYQRAQTADDHRAVRRALRLHSNPAVLFARRSGRRAERLLREVLGR